MIVVPDMLWERLLDLLLEPEGTVERVGFIDGVITDELTIATTVVVPRATLRRGFYDVCAAAMSDAGKHLRRHGLHRIAQVHTHGGSWVGHSERDDELAYSHDDGSLSIVVPHHARDRPRLSDCGIHAIDNGSWTQLRAAEVDALFRTVPSSLNLRSPDAEEGRGRRQWLPTWMRR